MMIQSEATRTLRRSQRFHCPCCELRCRSESLRRTHRTIFILFRGLIATSHPRLLASCAMRTCFIVVHLFQRSMSFWFIRSTTLWHWLRNANATHLVASLLGVMAFHVAMIFIAGPWSWRDRSWPWSTAWSRVTCLRSASYIALYYLDSHSHFSFYIEVKLCSFILVNEIFLRLDRTACLPYFYFCRFSKCGVHAVL